MAFAGTLVNATTQYINADSAAVTAFDSANTFAPTMKTFYDTVMLDNARDQLIFTQLGEKEALGAHKGSTIEWRQWNTLPDADLLVEGVIPTGKKFGLTSQNVSLTQYGLYVPITDKLQLHALDDVVAGATEEVGASLGRAYEKVTRAALLLSTNVLFADAVNSSSSNAYVSTPAARHELSNGATTYCGLSPDMLAQAYTNLLAAKAPFFDGKNYLGVIHPYVQYDLRKHADWQRVHQYAATTEIFNGEIGELNGIRFLVNTLAPIVRGDDLTDSARTLTVASYSTSGGTGAQNEITLVEALSSAQAAALAGREVIISGEHMTIISATAANPGKFIVSDADETAWGANPPASPDVVYPGEGGALGISIFQNIFLGKNAFKVIDPEGAGIEMIHMGPETGIGGPLKQFSTIGGKFETAAKIVYPERICIVESASAYSATAEEN